MRLERKRNSSCSCHEEEQNKIRFKMYPKKYGVETPGMWMCDDNNAFEIKARD